MTFGPATLSNSGHPEPKRGAMQLWVVTLAALLLLSACSIFALPQTQNNDECEVPAQLRSTLDHQWRGWRVLHISDLTPEDQNLWTYARGRICPGASYSHFLDPKNLAYALALIRGKQEAVVLASNGPNWRLETVMPPARKNRFEVIWAAKPGTYEDIVTHRKAQSTAEGIALESIGASVTIFVRQKNRFVPIRTSP